MRQLRGRRRGANLPICERGFSRLGRSNHRSTAPRQSNEINSWMKTSEESVLAYPVHRVTLMRLERRCATITASPAGYAKLRFEKRHDRCRTIC